MLLSNLMQQAARESAYGVELSEERTEQIIQEYSTDPSKCLFYSDTGFILGLLTTNHLLLHGTVVALEIAWYVAPEARGKLEGGRLYKQFEKWALDNKAKAIFVGKQIKDSILVQPGYIKWVSKQSQLV